MVNSLKAPARPGLSFMSAVFIASAQTTTVACSAEGGLQPEPGITDDDSEKILNVIRTRVVHSKRPKEIRET